MGKTVARFALSPISAVVSLVDKRAGAFLFTAISTAAAFIPGAGPLISAGLNLANAATGAYQLGQAGVRQQLSRLNLTFDAEAPRKLVFGNTAFATDLLYWEPSGAEQEYADYVIGLAAHAVESVDELWLDTELAWTAAGGAQGRFVGYLTVTPRAEGTAANALSINGGTVWNASNCRLTGCAYMVVRVRRTGVSKKSESPFAGGLNGRMTVRGKGMRLYDPRQDSTRGGSGSHRADNQATWTWGTHSTNPALMALAVLLGWRIGGEVSVGAGVPVGRIAFADFAAAANVCDEAVPLKAGGTHKRYEAGGLFTDSDSPAAMLAQLEQAMHGELRDVFGRIGIRMKVNDLAGPQIALAAADVLGAFQYQGTTPLAGQPNIVRGRFIDSSNTGLYQPTPYVEAKVPSTDGVNRVLTLDLPLVQDPIRARRIALQALRRARLGGSFSADFGPRAWALRPGDPARLAFPVAGLADAQMRVERQELKIIGSGEDAEAFCPLLLVPDAASVYAWVPADDELVPDTAVAPVVYDATRSILYSIETDILSVTAPSTGTVVGTSSVISRIINPGASVTAYAKLSLSSTTGSGAYTLQLDVQAREAGGTWATLGSSTLGATAPAGISVESDGTATNLSSDAVLWEFRTVATLTPGFTGAVNPAESFLNII